MKRANSGESGGGRRTPASVPAGLRAFTLIELLAISAIFGLLSVLLVPGIRSALEAAREAACASNLKQLQAAYLMYLRDHQGRPFPFYEDVPEGRLWYWGLEPGGAGSGAEGRRALDPGRGRLAPYLGVAAAVRTCPSLPYGSANFKQKFSIPSSGYGINYRLLAGARGAIRNWAEVARPAEFLVWADSIQINTWQSPASARNPMLEEWYYIAHTPPASLHFRHGGRLNAAFGDGSVRSLKPGRLDPRCDGRAGFLPDADAARFLNPAP